MKKAIFTLVLIIAQIVTVNAQGLTGKEWCTMIPDEDGNDIAFEMTFENNGSCGIEVIAVEEMKESGAKMIIDVQLDIPGTYTLNGKDLKLNLDKGKAKVDIDVDIEGMDAQTKTMMKQMIKPELEKGKNEVKEELLKVIPVMDNMRIVTLENNRLVLADSSGKEITFYAKKD